jgi:hypothetical protein
MWKQKELWDGSYSFLDLLDVNELLDVKEANEALTRKQMREG